MGRLKTSSGASRKEARKAHKLAAKEKKQQRHVSRAAQQTDAEAEKPVKSRRSMTGGTKVKQVAGGGGRGGFNKSGNTRGGVGKGGGVGSMGSAEVGRRKRWKPEEIDPMIAAEDAEMTRLERLLGVSGPNADKKRAKLSRELEVEDGLGDEFGAFLTDLDRIAEAVEGGASGSSDDGRKHEADWDFHRDVSEVSSESEPGGGGGGRARAQVDVRNRHKRKRVRWLGEEAIDDGEADGAAVHVLQQGIGDEEDRGEGENQGGDVVSERYRGGGRVKMAQEQEFSDEEGNDDGSDESAEGGHPHLHGSRKSSGHPTQERKDDRENELEDERNVNCDDNGGEASEASGEEDEEREAGEKETEDFLRHVYRPKPGQDIYGRTIASGNAGATPAKYVPPHLRAAAAASEGAGGVRSSTAGGEGAGRIGVGTSANVQRVVNGITNRLSEETMEPVTARLKEAYRGYSTTEVNEALWQSTRAVCVHDKHVMTTLIPPYAAVIAALNISLGADVGGFFLEVIAKELNAVILSGAKLPAIRHGNGRRGLRGTGSNVLLLLAYLYNYGVAHCTLIYDIIGLLVDAFGESEMELLLLLLQHSGFQLRSDDAHALKQIVALVKEKVNAATTNDADPAAVSLETTTSADDAANTLEEEKGRWKTAFGVAAPGTTSGEAAAARERENTRVASQEGGAPSGSRARYILDTILELQCNKRSRLQEQGLETGRRVRKWLGSVKSAKGGVGVARGSASGGGGDASLRVAWAELVSTGSSGRWWRVGAAWAGRTSADADGESKPDAVATASTAGVGGLDDKVKGKVDGFPGDKGDEEEVGLMELAARQRMNTDVRRSVFVAIVGSSDCEDALEKILRLNLKGAQEREVARVIVECCCQEGSYNPFYAHLAERACDRQPKLRFTFRVAFWDSLKTIDEGAARRAGSLARLMAHLVVCKQLSLTILKSVEFPELSPSGLLLVRVFFYEIISSGDDASFMEVFRRLARPPGSKDVGGHSTARDNTLVFLRGHLGPAPRSWDRERKKVFRKRVKGACRLIDAMVTAEELGS